MVLAGASSRNRLGKCEKPICKNRKGGSNVRLCARFKNLRPSRLGQLVFGRTSWLDCIESLELTGVGLCCIEEANQFVPIELRICQFEATNLKCGVCSVRCRGCSTFRHHWFSSLCLTIWDSWSGASAPPGKLGKTVIELSLWPGFRCNCH